MCWETPQNAILGHLTFPGLLFLSLGDLVVVYTQFHFIAVLGPNCPLIAPSPFKITFSFHSTAICSWGVMKLSSFCLPVHSHSYPLLLFSSLQCIPLFFSSVIWHQERPHRERLSCANASLIISKLHFKLDDINVFRSIFSVFKKIILSLLNNSISWNIQPTQLHFLT